MGLIFKNQDILSQSSAWSTGFQLPRKWFNPIQRTARTDFRGDGRKPPLRKFCASLLLAGGKLRTRFCGRTRRTDLWDRSQIRRAEVGKPHGVSRKLQARKNLHDRYEQLPRLRKGPCHVFERDEYLRAFLAKQSCFRAVFKNPQANRDKSTRPAIQLVCETMSNIFSSLDISL